MVASASLATFLPIEARIALAEGRPLAGETKGAALLADISGFTPLTAAFANELGATRGAEELVRELGRLFEILIGEVHCFGGSVIGFAGDAITCWFDAEEASESRAASRAVSAGIAMRDAVAKLGSLASPSGRVFPIGVKIAISAGPVKRFVVGASGRQRFETIAGATCVRMAAAEQMASAGEIVVSSEVVEMLPSTLRIAEWRQSGDGIAGGVVEGFSGSLERAPGPKGIALADEVVRPWLVREVFDRIVRGEEAYLGGFRRVAALFLRFEGIDYDADPDAGRQLDGFVTSVQEKLASLDGHLVDLTMGDKGSYLFAAFGALRAHEDDARRAVTAASALTDIPSAHPTIDRISIGIAYAHVYAGSYGCSTRRTFGIVGRQVIVAARLMSQAEAGEILVTGEIAEADSRSHLFEARDPIALKGLAEPIAPHLFVGERDAAHEAETSLLPMVGRAREQAALTEALERWRRDSEKSHRPIILEGEAGMGKTTLLRFVRGAAEEAGVKVLGGAADAIRRSSPYHAWRPIFESAFGIGQSRDDGQADQTRRVTACRERLTALGDGSERLLPLLNPALGLSLPDNETTRGMEGPVRADNANDLLVRILRSEAESGPILILLEDLHWFDSASATVLRLVARELDGVLLVMTRRPHVDESPDPDAAFDSELLRLGPLDRAETEQLLLNALGATSVTTELAQWIADKAEGSPFFSQEFAFALRDSGVLVVESGLCRLAHGAQGLSSLEFPDTIEGVIASRLDQLPRRPQMAVKVASVIGRLFAVRVLHDVHPVAEHRSKLPHSLSTLESAEIASKHREAQEPSYLFNHVLTQEVAYGRLLHEQRTSLHRDVGEWLERHPSGDPSTDLPLLAHHFGEAAHDPGEARAVRTKALEYLGRAGNQALHAHMNQEAIRFFSDAIELSEREEEGDPALWHAGLAHAYMAIGEFPSCQEHARIAFRLIGTPFPESTLGLIRQCLGQLTRAVVRALRRRSLFPPAGSRVALADPNWEPQEPRRLLRVLAKSLFHKNDGLGMLCCNLRSLNLSEQAGPGPEMALCYGHAMLSLAVLRMPKQANAFGLRAVEIARSAESPATLVAVYIARGLVQLGYAAWGPACEAFEEARNHASELGDDWQWGEAQAILADIALFRGDVGRGRLLYGELEENADRRAMPIQKAWCMRPKVLEALEQGKPSEALGVLAATRGILDRVYDPLIRIDALGFEALAYVRAGEDAAALEPIAEAHRMIPQFSPPVAYPRFLGYRALGEACLTLFERQPDSHARRKDARYATRYMKGYGQAFAFGRPRAVLLQGWYHAILGRSDRARRELELGVEMAEALGMEPDLVLGRRLIERFRAT